IVHIKLDKNTLQTNTERQIRLRRAFVPEPIIGDYIPYVTHAADGTDPNGFNYLTDMSANIYAKYDALVSAHPSYIKKTLLGNDGTGALPIYQYEFLPYEASLRASEFEGLPKVLLTSGAHGNGGPGDN